MKITSFSVQNFQGIIEAEIELYQFLTVLGGENGSGKSSLCKAVESALQGKSALPADAVRHGADKAEVTVTTDEGYKINVVVGKDNEYKLKITAGGMNQPSPVAWLKSKFGSVDGGAFLDLDAAKQAEQIRKAAGVDTSEIDAAEAALAAARLQVGKAGKEKAGFAAGLPGEPGEFDLPSMEDALAAAEVTAAAAHRSVAAAQVWDAKAERVALDEARTSPDDARRDLDAARALADAAAEAARQAARALEEAEALDWQWRSYEQAMATARGVRQSLGERPAVIAVPDTAAMRQELDAARAGVAKHRALADAESYRKRYAELTAEIEAARTRRADTLRNATWPVEGLGLDDAGRLTYLGALFENASQAQRLRVSLGVQVANGAPILFLRDGAFLSLKSLEEVRAWVEEHGVQVIVERVGDADAGAVIIEGGRVRDAIL